MPTASPRPTRSRNFCLLPPAFCLSLLLPLFLPALHSCATWATYPPVEGDAAVADPNVHPLPTVIETALVRVFNRYPVDGRFTINFPEGMDRDRAQRVARDAAERAPSPMGPALTVGEPGWDDAPLYHVSELRIRADRAEVEILRPVAEADAHQPVTVRLLGGVNGWITTSTRTWPIGFKDTPPLYSWPDPTSPNNP